MRVEAAEADKKHLASGTQCAAPSALAGNAVVSVGTPANAAPSAVSDLIERSTTRACSRSIRCALLVPELIRVRNVCAAALDPNKVPKLLMGTEPEGVTWYCTALLPDR